MDFSGGYDRIDLSGKWWFAYSMEALSPEPTGREGVVKHGLEVRPCVVPGNFELDLQAAGIIPEPFFGMNISKLTRYERAHIWYGRRFSAEGRADCDAELVFHGLDCIADVYLNGELVGRCDNMLVEHVLALGDRLKGDNELLVHIRPAVEQARRYDYPPNVAAMAFNYESLYIRKAPHMYGWDIMPRAVSAGIWRPVELRFRPRERLERVFLETLGIGRGGESARLMLHYQARTSGGPEDRWDLEISGTCEGSAFSARERMWFDAGHITFSVSAPRLWWPAGRGRPDLYRVTVTLLKNGRRLDSMEFTHGIRTVELERTSTTDEAGRGEFCFRVNGERLFVKGTNWVPVDAYHSRDVGRIAAIMDMASDLGCNMIRCWGGNVYENDLFYRLCDERGILVWQDFAMACAIYPQDPEFQGRVAAEARQVIRRLRQHACLALWCGDNECDLAYQWFGRHLDPNTNVLTRRVLPEVLKEEDPRRPYLPSSPYVDEAAFRAGERFLPEHHLWGPRDYYKSAFYRDSLCHFASEIGYHGCPAPESVRRFISPGKEWPYRDNEEWLLHATSPVPGAEGYNYRIELMAKQIRELFGEVPETLEDFAFASQVSQAEAKKFFIELFRANKWRRTGIIWWNLMDGWPQFSDAIVDYYFTKKLAYDFIKASQRPLCVVLREPENWRQEIVACNDTRDEIPLAYTVTDVGTGEVVAAGEGRAAADAVTVVGEVPFSMGDKRFYVIEWESASGRARNHYLAGNPPFDLGQYREWLERFRAWESRQPPGSAGRAKG